MSSITYLEAIRLAQRKALADDPRVFIYGQDIGGFGGAFKATKNLAKEFPGRVLDAPISEDAMVGMAIGFIPPPHLPTKAAGAMAAAAGVIFAGTALPEEILFRSLIQNLLMLRFGQRTRVLLLASFIFGCAHLDNGPQPLPNWRYMILATIAGIAYGTVYRRSSTVLSSAALHCLVDWTKHFFF